MDDDIPVFRREIWRETDRQYRASAEALIKVQTSQQVQVQTAKARRRISRPRRRALTSGRAWKSTSIESPGRTRATVYGRV